MIRLKLCILAQNTMEVMMGFYQGITFGGTGVLLPLMGDANFIICPSLSGFFMALLFLFPFQLTSSHWGNRVLFFRVAGLRANSPMGVIVRPTALSLESPQRHSNKHVYILSRISLCCKRIGPYSLLWPQSMWNDMNDQAWLCNSHLSMSPWGAGVCPLTIPLISCVSFVWSFAGWN